MKNYINIVLAEDSNQNTDTIINYISKLKSVIQNNNIDISTELDSINNKLYQIKVLSVL
jgi:hypothetical protein